MSLRQRVVSGGSDALMATYALGLLPIENKKQAMTRPAIRNYAVSVKCELCRRASIETHLADCVKVFDTRHAESIILDR